MGLVLLQEEAWSMQTYGEKVAVCKSGKGGSPEPNHTCTLKLDSPHFRTMRNKFLLFKPPIYSILL